jgi:hypothetical protein
MWIPIPKQAENEQTSPRILLQICIKQFCRISLVAMPSYGWMAGEVGRERRLGFGSMEDKDFFSVGQLQSAMAFIWLPPPGSE